jgi:ubiquinone/menaquinone biosynthesis C-methylase UbiE
MPDNTHRFTDRAEDYDRYRLRYPAEEILAHLREWCGLSSDWLVADIGAGTGMSAEVFLANRNRVLAIEPNPDMRSRMSALFNPGTAPKLRVIDATAENTALPDASIDLVAAGRAFHWFDRERSLAEFRRILKPRGWVTLIAADRDRDTDDPIFRPQIDAWESLLAEPGTDYTRVRSGYRSYEKMDNFFRGEVHQTQLHSTREMDWPTFRGHAMSLSVTPQPGHANYEAFQRALGLHFDTFACTGILTIPTTCWITAARLNPQ